MILNEKKYAKNVLLGRVKLKNIYQIVSLLSRYNYHEVHMSDEQSYSFIVQWLQVHNLIFSEYKYSSLIQDCVRKAPKCPFYQIDSIDISRSELEKIQAIGNIRQEKILFVLLCMAKFQAVAFGFKDNFVTIKIPELFKTARVSVPSREREAILYQLKKLGYIKFPQRVDSQGLFVTLDADDGETIKLGEAECDELAYTYLQLTDQGKITHCEKCGRLIKRTKLALCKDCAEKTDNEIVCVDCGAQVVVSAQATKTCRCPTCQQQHNRKMTTERVRKYRESL